MRLALFFTLAVCLVITGSSSTLEAAPPNCVNVHMHPNSLPAGQVGMPYSQIVWLTPASAFFYIWNPLPAGAPPGLVLVPGPNANQATITGTPTASGAYTFAVTGGGVYVLGAICFVTKTFSVTIAP